MATEANEITKIEFDWQGSQYTMEFDRDSVTYVEKLFDVKWADVTAGKFTAFKALFHASFLKHHPHIKESTVNTLFAGFTEKTELFKTLVLMYNACMNTLMDEPEEDSGNAISWKAS